MADLNVDINSIRPSGGRTQDIIDRQGPTPLSAVRRAPLREDQRYRSAGRMWRRDLSDTRKALEGPVDGDVQARIQKGQRLSRPGVRGVR